MLKKRISHAFGKDIYLLGKDMDGQLVWLESSSWDCNWYWGFGYLETYTNNSYPNKAKDIKSHTHFNGYLWGKDKICHYNRESNKWEDEPLEYHHHINESNFLAETVLTESESWELSDLMKQFYTLKEAAAIVHTGSAHLTSSKKVDSKNQDMYKIINEILLPPIFKRIYEILTPEEK